MSCLKAYSIKSNGDIYLVPVLLERRYGFSHLDHLITDQEQRIALFLDRHTLAEAKRKFGVDWEYGRVDLHPQGSEQEEILFENAPEWVKEISLDFYTKCQRKKEISRLKDVLAILEAAKVVASEKYSGEYVVVSDPGPHSWMSPEISGRDYGRVGIVRGRSTCQRHDTEEQAGAWLADMKEKIIAEIGDA